MVHHHKCICSQYALHQAVSEHCQYRLAGLLQNCAFPRAETYIKCWGPTSQVTLHSSQLTMARVLLRVRPRPLRAHMSTSRAPALGDHETKFATQAYRFTMTSSCALR